MNCAKALHCGRERESLEDDDGLMGGVLVFKSLGPEQRSREGLINHRLQKNLILEQKFSNFTVGG